MLERSYADEVITSSSRIGLNLEKKTSENYLLMSAPLSYIWYQTKVYVKVKATDVILTISPTEFRMVFTNVGARICDQCEF